MHELRFWVWIPIRINMSSWSEILIKHFDFSMDTQHRSSLHMSARVGRVGQIAGRGWTVLLDGSETRVHTRKTTFNVYVICLYISNTFKYFNATHTNTQTAKKWVMSSSLEWTTTCLYRVKRLGFTLGCPACHFLVVRWLSAPGRTVGCAAKHLDMFGPSSKTVISNS